MRACQPSNLSDPRKVSAKRGKCKGIIHFANRGYGHAIRNSRRSRIRRQKISRRPRNLFASECPRQRGGRVSRGQQACLVCPEANEKECKNWKLIKKAETKNHHQIILGNHEFSGKRLEEKSEKGKRYHRKCERV